MNPVMVSSVSLDKGVMLLALLFVLGISSMSIGYGANLIDRDLQGSVCIYIIMACDHSCK